MNCTINFITFIIKRTYYYTIILLLVLNMIPGIIPEHYSWAL